MNEDPLNAKDVDQVIVWCERCEAVTRGPMVAVALWSESHLQPRMLAVRVNASDRDPVWVRMGVAA